MLAVVQNVKKDREMCWKKSQGYEQFLSLRTQLLVVVNDSKRMLGKDFLWNLENSTPFYNTQSQGSFLKQQQKYLLHIYFKTKTTTNKKLSQHPIDVVEVEEPNQMSQGKKDG